MFNDDDILEFKLIITDEKYYNEDTSWGSYLFYTKDNIPQYYTNNIDHDRKFSTLVGKMQELVVGGEYMIKAKYNYDKKYGHQYNPIAVYALVPHTKNSQLMFLQSIINEQIANNLIEAYPNIVEDVINGKISEIDYSKVKGVGEKTWDKIKEKIINNYLISDIIIMLKPLGVTYTMIKKLLTDEPNPALLKKQLEDNPYLLVKIKGLGFKRVDNLALKLKPQLTCSVERLIAFIRWYFIELADNDGHTWCVIDSLKSAISNYIPECYDKIDWLLENNDFIQINDNRVGLKYFHDVEEQIYKILVEKSKMKASINIPDDKIEIAIRHAENEQGFEYVDEQLNAIKNTLHRSVSLITGKAGCGKTSIMRAIIRTYTENNYSVSASALSAMAAQRITDATSFPAMTIHRTLGCIGLNHFTYDENNHLKVNVAFLDEGSMVNATLFLQWLKAIDDKTIIIISGDHKQLPPIGYGNVFSDLIEKLDKNVVSELIKPMRQAKMSGILVDANLIRENINPIKEKLQPKIVHGELQDMYYMFRNNRRSLFDIAVKTYLNSIKTDGIDNVVIAVPRKKDCLNSTFELNKVIQNELLGDEKKSISYYENEFKLGAKVMQTKNNYEKGVFNGEVGYITEINECKNDNGKIETHCIVTYKDSIGESKKIEYTKKELGALDLAYAMTVHKLQGAGRNTVIGIIDNTHYQLLDNCMLYTMLTRAKKRCLLLAEPQAFLQCIHTSHNRRNTWMMLKRK